MHLPDFFTIDTASDVIYRQQNIIPPRNNFQCINKNMTGAFFFLIHPEVEEEIEEA